MARRIVVIAALCAASCGGRARTDSDGPERGPEGTAPETPLTVQPIESLYEFCLQRAAQHCDRMEHCCELADPSASRAACVALETRSCRPDVDTPDYFVPESAGECLAHELRAYEQCALLPATETVAQEYHAACDATFALPYQIGGICFEDDYCPSDPDRIILCDARTDGVGDNLCHDLGPRLGEGRSCYRDRQCELGLICLDLRCSAPQSASQECARDAECESGYCDCDGANCNLTPGICDPRGAPVAAPGECELLSALTPHLLVARDLSQLYGYTTVVDDAYVYWSEDDAVYRASKLDGSSITQVFDAREAAPPYPRVIELAVDAEHVYILATGRLSRVSKMDGRLEEVLFEGYGADMLLLETHVVVAGWGCDLVRISKAEFEAVPFGPVVEPDGSFAQLAADENRVFCASSSAIWAAPHEAGELELLARNGLMGPMVVVGETMYWGSFDGVGEFSSMSKDGGDVTALAELSGPMSSLVHDTSRDRFFWIRRGEALETFAQDTGVVEVHAPGLPAEQLLVQDEDFLYFTNESGVMRVAKSL